MVINYLSQKENNSKKKDRIKAQLHDRPIKSICCFKNMSVRKRICIYCILAATLLAYVTKNSM